MSLNLKNVDKELLKDTQALIDLALAEDIGSGDVTCEAVIPKTSILKASIRFREPGVVCGLWAAALVYQTIDEEVRVERVARDGDHCEAGQVLMTVEGAARSVLTGERTALNFLQHLCGISTFTDQCVSSLGKSKTKLLDTRKTTPGMRLLEKYAVRCGGGHNHRMGLYDRIMIKDNHLALRSLVDPGELDFKKLVEQARLSHPHVDIQIEVDRLEQYKLALEAHPDWILLDNMSDEDMTRCVQLNDRGILLEASGMVTLDRLKAIAACGVDAISMGVLTHSVPAVDIGLDYL